MNFDNYKIFDFFNIENIIFKLKYFRSNLVLDIINLNF